MSAFRLTDPNLRWPIEAGDQCRFLPEKIPQSKCSVKKVIFFWKRLTLHPKTKTLKVTAFGTEDLSNDCTWLESNLGCCLLTQCKLNLFRVPSLKIGWKSSQNWGCLNTRNSHYSDVCSLLLWLTFDVTDDLPLSFKLNRSWTSFEVFMNWF